LRRQRNAERHPHVHVVSKVKRKEEGRTFQREGPLVAKDLVWAMVVPTRGIEPTNLKSGIVDVKVQIKGSECDPENILEQHPVWTSEQE